MAFARAAALIGLLALTGGFVGCHLARVTLRHLGSSQHPYIGSGAGLVGAGKRAIDPRHVRGV
jgi:hypothetical protein